jgi:glycosyltransferase involved in cell wall biosynthesis
MNARFRPLTTHVARAGKAPNPLLEAESEELDVRLETELPQQLAVGRGSAMFLYGSCFHPGRRIAGLEILVENAAVPALAYGMPRLDLFNRGDPYRSGFWAIVPLPALKAPTRARVRARATFEGGGQAVRTFATMELEPALEPPDVRLPAIAGGDGLVAICMATYNPPIDLFERQIQSIREQTHDRWICLVSDDASDPRRFAEIEAVIADDPRFAVSRSDERLGFYGNFERAMAMAPQAADFVALADHDDRWYPEKLEVLISSLGDANLVYSDARVVTREGETVSDTFWSHRRNNHTNFASLLIANTITGAASLFRRELLEFVLPLPPRHGGAFHDHWIGLVALGLGRIEYVDRPLYDYVQHPGAAFGYEGANQFVVRRDLRHRLARLRRGRVGAAPAHGWRTIYFLHYCRMLQVATALRLRTAGRLAPRKRRTLDRFLAGERSPGSLAWLAARRLRRLVGLNETAGFETWLLRGIGWRHLTAVATRRQDRPSRRRRDARMPRAPARGAGAQVPYAAVRERLTPLPVGVRADVPERVNILVPTMDLKHFFGAYIGTFNLARKLAERGLRTRLVAADPTRRHLPPKWKERVESYSGLAGLFDEVEVAFARDSWESLAMNPRDCLVATTTWTAHAAHRTLGALERERFVYLIQEYDPLTYPAGTFAALTAQAYEFPHLAVFSTELLRDYFRRHRIGVFAAGEASGEASSVAFENAITPVEPRPAAELESPAGRRFLFYARPEDHARRNMFELGVMALSDALASGVFGPDWEFAGIGAVDGNRVIDLGGGATLEVLARQDQDSYAELLRSYDAGLALMYTPHPSLVPIEMAAAGMLVVTNSFENKVPDTMTQISENLITVPPTLEGVGAGLRRAADEIGDVERRLRGSAVRWSRDWESSYNDRVMERVTAFLAES